MKKETITFPKNEWQDIRKRLDGGRFVFSVRVSADYDRFKIGKVYFTEWEDKIKIIDSQKINSIEDYEYVNELSKEQKEYLEQFNNLNIIKFKKIK